MRRVKPQWNLSRLTFVLRLALALVSGLAAVPVSAQGAADGLARAVEQAWARQPEAAAAAARMAEARSRAEAAASLMPGAPSVSVSQLNDRLTANRGRQEWEVEVAAPLWLPGQRAARRADADAAGVELAARQAELRLRVAGQVREAAWALAASREARDVAERRLATAQALEDDVLRRYRAGDLARIDANLAQTERLAAQAERLEAQGALRLAEQAWRVLTGGAAPARIDPEPLPTAAATLDDHAQLAARVAAARAARARLQLAERSSREAPQVALRAGRERADAGERFANTVGLTLTVPLSFGPQLRLQRYAAQAELEQAEAELARLREELPVELERTRAELDAVTQQRVIAQQRRELAADNLRLAERSFALGESDLAALLRARASAFEAEAFDSRQKTHLGLVQSRVRQALGVLP